LSGHSATSDADIIYEHRVIKKNHLTAWILAPTIESRELSSVDIAKLVGRSQVVNIKLDKAGGLTEGLATAKAAGEFGLDWCGM